MGNEIVKKSDDVIVKENAFVGFVPVKNWNPLLKMHEEVMRGPTPILEIKYVCVCCKCGNTEILASMVRAKCICKHVYCENCKVTEKNNMEQIVPEKEALKLDAPITFESESCLEPIDDKCKCCEGTGKVVLIMKPRSVGMSTMLMPPGNKVICPDCKGTGKQASNG